MIEIWRMRESTPARFRDHAPEFWQMPVLVACVRCKSAAQSWNGHVSCSTCGFSRRQSEPKRVIGQTKLVHASWKPRCRRCGGGLPKVARKIGAPSRHNVLIRCRGCGAAHQYPVEPAVRGADQECDYASGLPYFLRTTVRGRTLWVCNLAHLELLEGFVAARLRERYLGSANMTTIARLPAWIKAAGSRAELSRALGELRARAQEVGIA